MTAVELWQLINEYRADNGKPAVALSSSLTLVANAHGWDSATNGPVQGTCNLHPWSDRGRWDECCYAADRNNYPDTGGATLSVGYALPGELPPATRRDER